MPPSMRRHEGRFRLGSDLIVFCERYSRVQLAKNFIVKSPEVTDRLLRSMSGVTCRGWVVDEDSKVCLRTRIN
jgi:hypothetical protein